ncbi:MAG: carboxymuconolactone decarboxylase family protein [Rhodospirillales bacterium]|nr:carboxymuconolactone decarboxylase family protein [Rhodospirillales bacterium]
MNAIESDTVLNEQARRLIAIGASAAVNCRPCLEHHVPLGSETGLTEHQIREAIEIGFGVNRGAHAKTKGYIDDVIADSQHADTTARCCDEETAEQTGCC